MAEIPKKRPAPDSLADERELDLGRMELLDVLTLAHCGGDCGGLDDLQGWVPHSVAGSHFLVPHITVDVR
jgi:hypothetical protein